MDPLKKIIEEAIECQGLSNDEAQKLIRKLEERTYDSLLSYKITQEEAWDNYFCLLHECDERGLLEDRRRILEKIDTKIYNPFSSSNPGVRFIAQLRARIFGLVRGEFN